MKTLVCLLTHPFLWTQPIDIQAVMSQFTTLNDAVSAQQRARNMLESDAHHEERSLKGLPLMFAANPKPKDFLVEVPFRIDDEKSVAKTLWSCLYYVQQNTVKKISKAWIKGICHRKQAKWPYRPKTSQGKGKGKDTRVPPWWTSEEVCIFREPDHVDRWRKS